MQVTPLILIVDDDLRLQYAMARLLNQAGYRTCQASDGLVGLQMVREQKPDLILLAVDLPDVSGIQVCREIKADHDLTGCLVVLLSGVPVDSSSQGDGLDGGADGYIIRPITNAQLLAQVRGMLRIQQTEYRLHASETKYRTLVEQASDGIFIADQSDRYIEVNPAGCRLLGYTREEIIGKTMREVIQLPAGQPLRLDELHRGNTFLSERVMIRKEGTLVPVEISAKQLPDGRSLGIVRDISERKRTEAALRQSEQRLRKFYDSGLVGVIYWNMDGQITDANDKFLEMVGYTRDDLTTGLIDWVNMTPPEYRYLDDASVAELKVKGINRTPFEKEYVRKDGTRMPVLIAGAMLDEARFNGVAFVLDITERKQTENALRESQKLLQATIDHTPALIYAFDTEGRFILANRKLESLFGVAERQLIGQTRAAIMPREIAESHRNNDLQVIVSRQAEMFEEENREADGQHFYLTLKFPLINADNRVYAVCGISTDITARKQVEAALRESESSLRESQRVAHVGHWSWDTQKNQVVWSDEMKRIFGLDPVTFSGDLDKIIAQAIHPDDQAKVNAANQAVLTEQKPAALEYRLVLPDQSVRTVWAVPGDRLVDPQGHILKLTGIVQDISEHKQAEQQILRLTRLYATLSQINEMIVRVKAQDELYRALCQVAVQFGEFDLAWVGLVAHTAGQIIPVADAGNGTSYVQALNINLNDPVTDAGPTGSAIRTGAIVVVDDIQNDPRMQPWHHLARQHGFRASVAIPFRLNGEILGALNLYSTESAFFRAPEEMRLLEGIGQAVSFALDGLAVEAERQVAEVALRESEARYRSLVEYSPDAIFVSRADQVTFVNPMCMKLFGATSPEQLLGQTPAALFHSPEPIIPQTDIPHLRERAASDEVREEQIIRCDGRLVEVEVSVTPLPERDTNSLHVVLRDITARKRAEAANQRYLRELSLLNEASVAFGQFHAPEMVGHEIIRALESLLNWTHSSIWLIDHAAQCMNLLAHSTMGLSPAELEIELTHVRACIIRPGEGVCGWVALHGQPLCIGHVQADQRDIQTAPAIQSILCVPLKVAGQTIGALNIESTKRDAFTTEDQRVLTILASQAATAIQNARLLEFEQNARQQLEALSRRLVEIQEMERKDLSRELHDRVGQNLTTLGINLNIVRAQIPARSKRQLEKVDDSLDLVQETMTRVRDVMADLRPPVLDDYGLLATLRWYSKQFMRRTGIAVTVAGDEPAERLPLALEMALFRITQEALTNVAKHAQVQHATVTLTLAQSLTCLVIADQGIGFDPARLPKSAWGLATMRERAETAGAQLRVQSSPGAGTRIIIEISHNG